VIFNKYSLNNRKLVLFLSNLRFCNLKKSKYESKIQLLKSRFSTKEFIQSRLRVKAKHVYAIIFWTLFYYYNAERDKLLQKYLLL